MKLLFSVGRFDLAPNANASIALEMATQMAKQGVQTCIIGEYVGTEDLSTQQNEVSLIRLAPASQALLNSWKYDNFRYTTKIRDNKLRMVAYFLGHPISFIKMLPYRRKRPEIQPGIKTYAKKVVSYASANGYDAIISVYLPFFQAKYVCEESIANHIPHFVYQLDPWGLSEVLDQRTKQSRIQQELELFSKSKYVFTTDLLIRKYAEIQEYSGLLDQMKGLPFPKYNWAKHVEPVQKKDRIIRVLYTGTTDDSHRKIRPILSAFIECGKLGVPLKITFIGKILSEVLREFLQKYPDMFESKQMMGYSELYEWIQETDFLLNVSNSLHMMCPSKLIEYFSYGLPIINAYEKGYEDTMTDLQNYPCYINFSDASQINELKEFLIKNAGRHLTSLPASFDRYSVPKTAEEMLTTIKEKLR